jgi:phosphohistidine phosphatase
MEIYLLRHGVAEVSSDSGADADRELTNEGRHKVKDVAKAAARAGVVVSMVVTSPYRRAVETARIAAGALGYEGDLLRSDALIPGGDPAAVWNEIRVHRDERAILLAGHEPLFSALGAYLLGVPDLSIDFKKGALLALEIDGFGPRPRGVLKWMLTSKLTS